jgi:protein-L-isoaspartate(D-aspartate) O-methyltransferase
MEANGPKEIAKRHAMVEQQIVARGVDSPSVIAAMEKIPRHLFVPTSLIEHAYEDRALSLGPGQSISQPYVVALMLQKLEIKSSDKVLDVGTGSGYQTAILAELAEQIWTIEIDEALSVKSQALLRKLGYKNTHFIVGDGKLGYKEAAPYDVIVVAAASEKVPRELISQLALGGRLILPLGNEKQFLVKFTKTTDGLISEELGGVQFVEMK